MRPTGNPASATSSGSPPSVAIRRRTRTSRRSLANCVRWRSNASANRVRRDRYYSPRYRREASVSETTLPLLLKALAVSGRDEDLSRVLHFVEQSPDAFSLDDCQVPGLKSLIPWSRRQFGSVPPQLAAWLASVRRRLESATAQKPEPPTDWARPADVACNVPILRPAQGLSGRPRERGRPDSGPRRHAPAFDRHH